MRRPPGKWNDAIRQAEAVANSLFPGDGEIKVLDAGCGSTSYLTFRSPTYVTGVDVSAEAIERHPGLNERRVCDIQRDDLGTDEYDASICWCVLEHLEEPYRALENIRRALKAGGVLVVAIPNVASIKGLVTKFTPYAFHKWFYVNVAHLPPEVRPTPTVLAWNLRRTALFGNLRAQGWKVEYVSLFEAWVQKKLRYRIGLIGRPWKLTRALTRVLTFGRIDAEKTEVIAILRKAT